MLKFDSEELLPENYIMKKTSSEFGVADLIGPDLVDQFAQEYWPNKFFRSDRPLEKIGSLAHSEWVHDLDKLASLYGGLAILTMPENKRVHNRKVPMSEALAFYELGVTLYLINAEQWIPELRRMCRALEMDLGLKPGHIACELFVSRKGSGTPPHFDHDINFNVQLRGEKKWKTAPNNNVSFPLWAYRPVDGPPVGEAALAIPSNLPNQVPEPSVTFHTKPGSVVFLPQGYWHQTEATSDSLAIAFVNLPPSWADLLITALRRRLVVKPGWRERVFEQNNENSKSGVIEKLLSELPETVRQITRDELYTTMVVSDSERYEVQDLHFQIFKTVTSNESLSLEIKKSNGPSSDITLPNGSREFVTWLTSQKASFPFYQAHAHAGSLSKRDIKSIIERMIEHGLLKKL